MPNGFRFNGVHSSTIAGLQVVTEYSKDLLPDMDNRLVNVPYKDGVIDLGYTFKERVIPVSFALVGSNITDYFKKAESVAKWLNTGTVKPFILDALPDRTFQARPMGKIDPERFAMLGRATVEFLVPDPAATGITQDIAVTQNTLYTYAGNYKTYPVFTITVMEAIGSLKLTKVGTNEFILVNRSFINGDIITIDTQKRKITLNGTDLRRDLDITSTWFTIDGDFEFALNSALSTIRVVYPERWL